jgi:class 3 adenylate cyclase
MRAEGVEVGRDLAQVAREVEKTRSAAVLCDEQWRLVWVSSQMKVVMGEDDAEKLGVGRHVCEAYLSDTWSGTVTTESEVEAFLNEFPLVAHDTPGGMETLRKMVLSAMDRWEAAADEEDSHKFATGAFDREAVLRAFDALEPVVPPPVWATTMDVVQENLPPMRVTEVHHRLYDEDGRFIGTLITYGSGLSARLLALVARGDEDMYERMARLFEPGRRQAAILFADLQMSGTLSRRLPSAAYFKLIRAITSAMDDVVVNHRGVVGKHAGEGVTAFFLAEDLGSSSAAARAAIDAARDVAVAARDAVKEAGAETELVDESDCLVNIGVHWGGRLYMGQLVTGGRLEVTALGDRVNETARIQESARDGQALASKSLIEHLSDEDAAAAGIDHDKIVYTMVSEVAGATDKAVRDAGHLPVSVL